MIIIQYCYLYSLHCQLDIHGLYATYCKFISLNNIPPTSAPGNHHCILCFYKFDFFKVLHINYVIQYSSFYGWLISLSIMCSEFIHVITNDRMSFFSLLTKQYYIICMYYILLMYSTTFVLLSPFSHMPSTAPSLF